MTMITLLAIIITIISLYFWLDYESKKLVHPENYQSRFQKYKIPSQFWEDYNQLNFYIKDMGVDECERVKFLIDDFTYKYAQIMDYKVYVDSVGNLISRYYDKEKQLLKFK